MCNSERRHVPSPAPWLSFTPCPLSCPSPLQASETSKLFLKSWHSPTGEDSDSLPFTVCWLPPDILVVKKKKKKQFRSIDLGKGLAAVKTGKSMVSTEKRVRYTSTQQFLGDKRPAVEKRAEWLAIYWKLYAAGCVSGSRCEQIVYVAVFAGFVGCW